MKNRSSKTDRVTLEIPDLEELKRDWICMDEDCLVNRISNNPSTSERESEMKGSLFKECSNFRRERENWFQGEQFRRK